MRYNRTDILGSNLAPWLFVSSAEACEVACNHTQGCAAFTLTHPPLLTQGGSKHGCQLKATTGPGAANSLVDTFVRVLEPVQFDFTGTYCGVARVPSSRIQRYSSMAEQQNLALGNHSKDAIPYLPSLVAGLDPRPWKVRGIKHGG